MLIWTQSSRAVRELLLVETLSRCLISAIIINWILQPRLPHLDVDFLDFVFGLSSSQDEVLSVAQGALQLLLVESTLLEVLVWQIGRQPKIIVMIFGILPELLPGFDLVVFGCLRADVNRAARVLVKARH